MQYVNMSDSRQDDVWHAIVRIPYANQKIYGYLIGRHGSRIQQMKKAAGGCSIGIDTQHGAVHMRGTRKQVETAVIVVLLETTMYDRGQPMHWPRAFIELLHNQSKDRRERQQYENAISQTDQLVQPDAEPTAEEANGASTTVAELSAFPSLPPASVPREPLIDPLRKQPRRPVQAVESGPADHGTAHPSADAANAVDMQPQPPAMDLPETGQPTRHWG